MFHSMALVRSWIWLVFIWLINWPPATVSYEKISFAKEDSEQVRAKMCNDPNIRLIYNTGEYYKAVKTGYIPSYQAYKVITIAYYFRYDKVNREFSDFWLTREYNHNSDYIELGGAYIKEVDILYKVYAQRDMKSEDFRVSPSKQWLNKGPEFLGTKRSNAPMAVAYRICNDQNLLEKSCQGGKQNLFGTFPFAGASKMPFDIYSVFMTRNKTMFVFESYQNQTILCSYPVESDNPIRTSKCSKTFKHKLLGLLDLHNGADYILTKHIDNGKLYFLKAHTVSSMDFKVDTEMIAFKDLFCPKVSKDIRMNEINWLVFGMLASNVFMFLFGVSFHFITRNILNKRTHIPQTRIKKTMVDQKTLQIMQRQNIDIPTLKRKIKAQFNILYDQ